MPQAKSGANYLSWNQPCPYQALGPQSLLKYIKAAQCHLHPGDGAGQGCRGHLWNEEGETGGSPGACEVHDPHLTPSCLAKS